MGWLAAKVSPLEVLIWLAQLALLAAIIGFAARGFLDWRRQRRRKAEARQAPPS